MAVRFTCEHTDGGARQGTLGTAHGDVPTPAFMPVGTAASVKGLMPAQVRASGAAMLLGNTYHLALRPGLEVVEALGGLRAFMGWDGPVLTDSGGYQVFSLAARRQLDDDGVTFRSHVDGAELRFTPESVMAAQRRLGSDIAMQLDECVATDAPRSEVERAVTRSLAWAERSLACPLDAHQACFPIVQGALDLRLRTEHARALAALGAPGYAIGGLSVGEPLAEMLATLAPTARALPEAAPRYLMGVGYPEDLLGAIALGVDLFDCVIPTRNARNAMAFTPSGRLRLRNSGHATDPRPLDPGCACPACRGGFSRAYLRHLVLAGEVLAIVLLSAHNLTFYQALLARARAAIAAGCYRAFARAELAAWGRPEARETVERLLRESGDANSRPPEDLPEASP